LGSACGQACSVFSTASPECKDGALDAALFEGLTPRRVKIKTSPGGGGAAEALVSCSKDKCRSGWHFKNMYVEAENPLDFIGVAGKDTTEKGHFGVVIFAMSDYHAPVHTFSIPAAEDEEDGEDDEGSGHGLEHKTHLHHNLHLKGTKGKEKDEKADEKEDEKEDEKKEKKDKDEKHTEKPKPKKKQKMHERACVDLPGVRLAQIEHSDLKSFVDKDAESTPTKCIAKCGTLPACKQAIFSGANNGCYLFKLATVEVDDFSDAYNSSYCGNKEDEDLMMTMLHQAYKGYVPKKPPPGPAAPGALGPPPPPTRVLSEARSLLSSAKKLYWQIAHVPNDTMGVMRDQGSDTVRVIPRNNSCFSKPGFIYMVACMTAKPVYVSKIMRKSSVEPPPFNDRCLAVGGECGATCGSGEGDDEAMRQCPLKGFGRRLQASPYESANIPRDMLVQRIEPKRSATSRFLPSRIFFHLFIFFIAISYVATIMGKFPGNFTDFYPIHTWDEIRTHGYLLEKFGAAVSCGCSAGEGKTTVLRNWIGKMAARPMFDDRAFPTFSKWVDVFCDEGHREGARILWAAWTDFLDTDPSIEFLEEWSVNLQNMSWDQAASTSKSPFDLRWTDAKNRRILPLVHDQAMMFVNPGDEVPGDGGVELAQDSLAKLKDLADVFKILPDNLKTDPKEPHLPVKDDCVLTRVVNMGVLQDESDPKANQNFTIKFSTTWKMMLDEKVKTRVNQLGAKSQDTYEKSLRVCDNKGKPVEVFGPNSSNITEKQFPLHFREPVSRPDREVILIYCARARPEGDNKDVDKTRTLDRLLWACLRPKAVRDSKASAKAKNPRPSVQEKTPLLQTERAWSSVTGQQVRRCVEGVVKRQEEKFLVNLQAKADSNGNGKSNTSKLLQEYTSRYMAFRSVDSDWEMARFCYGQIVGEGRDMDGEEVLILDHASPALLELISEFHSSPNGSGHPGMGLASMNSAELTQGCCGTTSTGIHSYAAKPSLEFTFANIDPDAGNDTGTEFQKKFRQELSKAVANQDMTAMQFKEKQEAGRLTIEVSGPGKLVELIRERNIKSIQVLNFQGQMRDTHPRVVVKKDLLAPYIGVRGKSGGLNFVVDLLQFRDGFIGTGEDSDPIPERMLYGIFDARHQPHPDFWRKVLPKFMNNTEYGYTYEVNDTVSLVQAPQSFALVAVEEDILDVLNGMTFNIMNVIRNRCGGVTSCGTNAVWRIDAREFSRQDENADANEYFDSRTKIEDTASTHMLFCKGKRSVYVQEVVCTGIAKLNADYLCAMQRWAEGAVQLFWLQIFRDKTKQLVLFGICILMCLAALYLALYGSWSKGLVGYNVICDIDGAPTLLLGSGHAFCENLYGLFSTFLLHTIDKVMFQMAVDSYMRVVDFALTWFVICLTLGAVMSIMAYRGTMPKVVRVVIMMENISYWLTSCSIFYWTSLTLFMVVGGSLPLMFNVTHFMVFVLAMNVATHSMINEYKSLGGCDELSIWRANQSYTLAAPLYVMAIVRGTISAWGIIWNRLDKSFWTSSDHGSDIIIAVTLWVTFIWIAFVFCVAYFIAMEVKQAVLNELGDHVQRQCQIGALCMLGFLAITVWEPFLSLHGFNKAIDRAATAKDDDRRLAKSVASLLVWWRSKAWIMRYITDFGLPLLVFSGALGGGVSLIGLATYASTVHGFRG